MKQKFIAWSKPFLYTCMGLGWIAGFDFASLVLFGEYSYPQKEEV